MIRNVYLSMLAGPVVPVPVPHDVMEALQSVQVTNDTGAASGFQITFSLSTRSPLHTIFVLSGGGAPPLFRVILMAVVNGVPHVLMDGVITRTEVTAGSTPGQGTLTLSGTDLSAMMNLLDLSGIPYPGMPVEARVLASIGKYAALGVVPLVIPRLYPEVDSPTEKIPLHRGTDLAYVTQLADAAGYTFYVDPGPLPGMSTAYWGPEIKVGVPQPALSLDFDAHRNVETLTFSFTGDQALVPIAYIQVESLKTAIPVPIPNLNPLQPPLGAVPPLSLKFCQMTDNANLSVGKVLMRALSLTGKSQDVVTAQGSLDVTRYGRLLKARGLVGVRGAGVAHDGLYYVKQVTTALKRGECKQSFTLTRNALVPFAPVLPA
jgi:hypothetical protein